MLLPLTLWAGQLKTDFSPWVMLDSASSKPAQPKCLKTCQPLQKQIVKVVLSVYGQLFLFYLHRSTGHLTVLRLLGCSAVGLG